MNPFKNEKLIKLGDQEILLRPSFENIAALEANVEPLMSITQRMSKGVGKVPMTLLAQVIFYCQAERKADNQESYRFSLEEIWSLVQIEGGGTLYVPILSFIGSVFAGDKNAAELSERQKKS